MEEYRYTPSNEVCSREFVFTLEEGRIKTLRVIGGCHGNLQGIAMLVKDRTLEEVIGLLSGIRCGGKNTSCPDQIACALKSWKNAQSK